MESVWNFTLQKILGVTLCIMSFNHISLIQLILCSISKWAKFVRNCVREMEQDWVTKIPKKTYIFKWMRMNFSFRIRFYASINFIEIGKLFCGRMFHNKPKKMKHFKWFWVNKNGDVSWVNKNDDSRQMEHMTPFSQRVRTKKCPQCLSWKILTNFKHVRNFWPANSRLNEKMTVKLFASTFSHHRLP